MTEIRNAIGVVVCGAAGLAMAYYCSLAFMAWSCVGLAMGWIALLLWLRNFKLSQTIKKRTPSQELDQFLERLK